MIYLFFLLEDCRSRMGSNELCHLDYKYRNIFNTRWSLSCIVYAEVSNLHALLFGYGWYCGGSSINLRKIDRTIEAW